ncbi:MAG: BrnT family toxin [Boseongicola sp.]|nr:BrnT family toxin [Boseongicola sp.]
MEITYFEWDANKRKANLQKHGVDFLYAALIFEGRVLTKIDDRQDYGEVREISLDMVDNEVYCVTHTRRGNRVRII